MTWKIAFFVALAATIALTLVIIGVTLALKNRELKEKIRYLRKTGRTMQRDIDDLNARIREVESENKALVAKIKDTRDKAKKKACMDSIGELLAEEHTEMLLAEIRRLETLTKNYKRKIDKMAEETAHAAGDSAKKK